MKKVWLTFLTVAGGAAVGGGGDLEEVHDGPQQTAVIYWAP